METARSEASEYTAWMNTHGHTATLYHFSTALNDYGPESSRTTYAAGYAVEYSGRLIRDDGSMAEYPTAGITVFCEDSQLPLAKLVKAGRALVTFDNGEYTPYFVACYNPRESETQRDQTVNPGTLPSVILHKLTPLIGGDGPKRFYDLRMTRVIINSANVWL